jgi:hypothetical protein
VRGVAARERFRAPVVDARGEQPVADRLRVHVRELLLVQIMQQHRAEAFQLLVERAGRALCPEGAQDRLADEPRHARHALCQLLRAADGRDDLGQEVAD